MLQTHNKISQNNYLVIKLNLNFHILYCITYVYYKAPDGLIERFGNFFVFYGFSDLRNI